MSENVCANYYTCTLVTTMGSKPTIAIFHDLRYRTVKGLFPVRLKVTFKLDNPRRWVRKYYGDGMYCSPSDFAGRDAPRSQEMRVIKRKINGLYSKASKIIEDSEELSVAIFESQLYGIALDSLQGAFDKMITFLRSKGEGRIGSARAYRTALNSLKAYANSLRQGSGDDIRFHEVDVKWLKAYERWMLTSGRTINTIGMHLRALRAIFNRSIADKIVPGSLYPFRAYKIKAEKKYKIPLNQVELQMVKDFRPENASQARALDYWLFSYYCNGMNMGDIAALRRSDIQEDIVIYDRNKTRLTKIQFKKILFTVDHQIPDIMRRWGVKSLDPNALIFPILENNLPALTVKNRVQRFTGKINKGLKAIAEKLEFKKKFTMVIARHTWANVMSNSDAEPRVIQEGLGHQEGKTTENYKGSLYTGKIRKTREAL